MKKKMLALVMAGTLVSGLLAGCGGTGTTTDSAGTTAGTVGEPSTLSADAMTLAVDDGGSVAGKEGKKTKLNCTGGNVTELGPFTNVGAGHMQYRGVVYMKLAYWVGNDMYSDCAESIEQVDDYSYRIKLYDGIYDSNGNPFDASDLVFCLEEIKNIGKISYHRQIEKVEQEDDLTVLITLDNNLSSSFRDFADKTLLVTKESYEASPDGMATDPVGFTQYKVTSFIPSSSVVYEKVEDYWQKDESKITRHYEANVDVIEMHMLTEAAQKVSGLQTGDLQLANELGYVNVTQFQGNPDFMIDEQLNISDCLALFFNMTDQGACADDLALRQAILYAIDKQELLDSQGLGETLKDFSCSVYNGFNEEWLTKDAYDYNPEKAKELLKESHYNGEPIRLLSSATEIYKTLAEIITANLQSVGINCEMVVREAAAWTSATFASAQEYDIAIKGAGYASGNIEDSYKKVGSDTVSDIPGTTFFGWKNQELIDLCNEVTVIGGMTPEKINQIHDICYENAVGMGLYCTYTQYVASGDVTDVWQYGTYYVPNATHFKPDYAVYAQ